MRRHVMHRLMRQHWLNRPTCWVLVIRCAVTGHDYGQHWTAMGLADPRDLELPWCSRCGGRP